ncbi:MAG TPA: hypothetical protein VKT73_03835 [Xanthobacteraceae bacterium]|nr:hypothetical protein [Xanthobacteraceae bacterium]
MAFSYLVMAGFIPAIHVFLCSKNVDARNKCGHDEQTDAGAIL